MNQTGGSSNTEKKQSGRKIWNGAARERHRLKARYEIQKRMQGLDDEENPPPCQQGMSETDRRLLQEALHRIGKNNSAFFSLKNLNQSHYLLNEPFSVSDVLWWTTTNDGTQRLVSESRLLSNWGHDKLKSFKFGFLSQISTCTLVEWAIWTGRDNLLPGIMLGGIDVTRHGSLCGESLCPVDPVLGKRFFLWKAPTTVKAYIAKQYHILRKKTLELWLKDTLSTVCQLCSRNTPKGCILCFDNCHHQVCDQCLWHDILNNSLRRFHLEDIFVCPVCDSDNEYDAFVQEPLSLESAQRRLEETLAKFHELPLDPIELNIKEKKSALRSSWAGAVRAGLTQSTRMDQYWNLIENIKDETSYQTMRRFLEVGMDVNASGEYGQTGLWVAVWKEEFSIARLLLMYGSDPNWASNGGISCLHLAQAFGNKDIQDLLIAMGGRVSPVPLDLISVATSATISDTFSTSILIDSAAEHEGAGSYVFDDFLVGHTIDTLRRLRENLPVAPSKKGEEKLCSVRSYYCDAVGIVVRPLKALLTKAFNSKDVMVFPYMRFLYYKDAGISLAPHVDLSRVDTESGQRSSHSFLLYLTTCHKGGETELIQGLPEDENDVVLASVKPVRGRLLLFPHKCPHRGLAVVDLPKHLIRGEVYIPSDCTLDVP